MRIVENIKEAEFIQTDLLTEEKEYILWRNKAEKVYEKLREENDFLEKRPYQVEYPAMYALRRNNVCAGACGVGKTIMSGVYISIIHEEFSRPGQIHVVAPNNLSLTSRWQRDLNLFSGLKPYIDIIKSEKDVLNSKKPIWLYTQDFIKRIAKSIARQDRNTIAHLFIKKHLYPNTLIIDEVHLLKPGTMRTQLWEYLSRKAKRRLVLSGTLSDGRLELIYTSLNLTYRQDFEYNHKSFMQTFSAHKRIATNYMGGSEQILDTCPRYMSELATDKLPIYSSLARKYIHRINITDPEVLDNTTLPKEVTYREVIPPSYEHRNFYRNIIEEYKEQLLTALAKNVTPIRALSLIQPLAMASCLPPNGIHNKKLERVSEIVATHKKIAIFSQYITVSRILHEYLSFLYPEQTIRLYATDPEVKPQSLSATKRDALLSKFLYDSSIKIGVFSINLASESIDLNVADAVIFYDLPWQAIKIQQAIYRAVRPGNPFSSVFVYFLVNSGMIDQHQFNLLEEKGKASKTILDLEVAENEDYRMIDTIQVIKASLGVM